MKLTLKQVLEAASEAYGPPGLMSHVRVYPDGAVLEVPYGHDMVCCDEWGHAIVTDMIQWAETNDDGTFVDPTDLGLGQVFERMVADIQRVSGAVDALEEVKPRTGQS
jgi:hypothetical protein